MGFGDISARMKANKEAKAETDKNAPARKVDPQQGYQIRGKMLGVLLRDARVGAGRSLQDCAHQLRVAAELVEAWEFGDDVPSLPQLEILAYYLGVAVSHFWGQETLESTRGSTLDTQAEYIALRVRMIGALLRQAREETGMSLEELGAAAHLPAERITQYELGELAVPMHELSVLAGLVKKNISFFLESSSQIGELLAQKEMWRHFMELPEDLRQFAANPLNMGFIEIAMMLAQMPTDRLRRVGESVLNITM
jgi:transcriptional regulator with XRE-family HTH domain